MKKLSEQEVIDKINLKQENQYTIIGNYKNKDTPFLVSCNYCGIEWECIPNTLFRSRIGKNCNHHINLNEDMVNKNIKNISHNKIYMIGKYNGSRSKTLMKCNECDYEWKTQPYLVYKDLSHCPRCSGHENKTTESFKKEIKKLVGNEYSLLDEYKGRGVKIKFRHNKCKATFMMTPHSFLSGSRCTSPDDIERRTAGSTRMSLEKANELMHKNRHGEYTIVGNYRKASQKADIKHEKCGRIFNSVVSGVLHNRGGCPSCYSSYGEDAVRDYLRKYNFDFKEQFKIKDCKNIRPLPFDFAVFKNDKLYCLIEYQGIQHYKPKFGLENFKLSKMRDKIKYKYCLNNKIKLIRIPYKRWNLYTDLQLQVFDLLNKKISHDNTEPSSLEIM